MKFKKWVKIIQTTGYNDARTTLHLIRFWQLAHESRDLPQAETQITLVKSRANSQNDNYFHSIGYLFFKIDHFE